MYEGIVAEMVFVAENEGVNNTGVRQKVYRCVSCDIVYHIFIIIQSLLLKARCSRGNHITDSRQHAFINDFSCISLKCILKAKVISLHAMEALGGEEI
jgi:hypothetical protein